MTWLMILLTRWVTTVSLVTYPLMFSKCGQIRRLKVSFLSSFGWTQTHNNWCINYRSPKLDLITDRLKKFWQQNHILPNIKNNISAISKNIFSSYLFKNDLYVIYTCAPWRTRKSNVTWRALQNENIGNCEYKFDLYFHVDGLQ